MLKVFCQFLHGEGDFVRHLKKMGYVVGHVQSYIGERAAVARAPSCLFAATTPIIVIGFPPRV